MKKNLTLVSIDFKCIYYLLLTIFLSMYLNCNSQSAELGMPGGSFSDLGKSPSHHLSNFLNTDSHY